MGGSYAMKLSEDYEVHGFDINKESSQYAIEKGFIKTDNLDELITSDLVILSLYPHDNISFIKNNLSLFNENQLITDLSGVKEVMVAEINKLLPSNYRYISHHPMCGRETLGIINANTDIFRGSNFIITPSEDKIYNPKDIEIIEKIALKMGFSNIIKVSPKEHDELIAYTSQLTHLLAVSLMLGNNSSNLIKATGDSFRDLTRIAKINENLWTELFLSNKNALIAQIDIFIAQLTELKDLIELEEVDALKTKLIQSREKRGLFDKTKN